MTSTEAPVHKPENALTQRPFRLLWFNNIAYFIVANAQRFVFGWLVLDGLGRSEGSQGIVVFTLGLPSAFLVLQAGAWADRWDRRRMLIVTQIGGAVVMAGTALAIAAGDVGFGWVIASSILAGSATAIGSPVRASLIPALVRKEQLFSAIAINAIAMTLSLILGPVLAKLVGDQFGFEGTFWFQAILMAVGLLFLIQLEVPPHETVRARRPIVAETTDALKHVMDDRSLKTLFGLLTMASFTVNPAVMVTVQAHIKQELGRTAGEAAIPFALMGLGIAISSFVVMRKGDMKNKGAAFQRAMMVGSTMTFLMGQTTAFAQLLALSLVMGLAGGFYINMNQGLIQANTPPELMGRVMGLYTLTSLGLMPFGALALGLIAESIGTGLAISGAAAIALAVVVTTYIRNAELRKLS